MLSHIKNESLINHWFTSDCLDKLRFRADSNRCRWFCRPLPSRSATEPFFEWCKSSKSFLFNQNIDKYFSLHDKTH